MVLAVVFTTAGFVQIHWRSVHQLALFFWAGIVIPRAPITIDADGSGSDFHHSE